MFRVGQRVVCVDATWRNRKITCVLTKGVVYTIRGFCETSGGFIGLLLEEIIQPDGFLENGQERGFYKDRFRPIVERKTDISIFKAMLTPAGKKERVNAR